MSGALNESFDAAGNLISRNQQPGKTLSLIVPVQLYPNPSGSVQTNRYSADALVFVWGGTVTALKVQGVAGSATNGGLLVPAGDTFEIDYTAAPYWCVYLLG